jgi:hypothetical protein
VIIIIEKFKELMINVDSKKADRCIVPANEINLYDSIFNHKRIGGNPIVFDGVTIPVDNIDLLVSDDVLNISIIGSYNSGNPFIKIIGLESSDILVYSDGVWNEQLEYTLPTNFIYHITTGLDSQKDLSESILIVNEAYEETVCNLATKIYGGTGIERGFTDVWVDVVNGDDNNNGMTKTTSFQTLSKALDLLNNTSTGDHSISVHLANGTYDYNLSTLNSMNKVEFVGDIYNAGDEVWINQEKPLIFQNSSQLSFKELRFHNYTDGVLFNGLCLALYNCDNFEVYHTNFRHSGDSFTLDNVGLLSLLNSNGAVVNSGFTYDNLQSGGPSGAGGIRVSNNSLFSWNNWNVTCYNLQWLVLNKEGWFFAHEEILTNNNAVPYSCVNTIGYYKCITKCPSDGGETISFYDAIHNDTNFSGATLDFTGMIMPSEVSAATEVKDVNHDTGIWATSSAIWLDPITAFVNLYRHSADYPIYKQGDWAANLVQVLPEGTNFVGASLTSFEEQKDFWESIQVTPSSELTVCEKFLEVDNKLDKSVYSEDGTVKDISYGEEPTIAESIARPTTLFLWNDD